MWTKELLYKVLEEANDKWNIEWLHIKKPENTPTVGSLIKYTYKDEVICICEVEEIYTSRIHNNKKFVVGNIKFSVTHNNTKTDNPRTVGLPGVSILLLPLGKITEYKYNLHLHGELCNISSKNPIIVEYSDKSELESYTLFNNL